MRVSNIFINTFNVFLADHVVLTLF